VWCWGLGAVTVGVGSGWVVEAAWVVGLREMLGSARRVFLGVAVRVRCAGLAGEQVFDP
jgi:hypothetical protein